MAWFDDCAYYATRNTPQQLHPGTVVGGRLRSKNPQATAYLNDPAMLDPWESLKVNSPREVAYHKPPAVGSASRPGSAHAQREPGY
jgi:hypothetical protein